MVLRIQLKWLQATSFRLRRKPNEINSPSNHI